LRELRAFCHTKWQGGALIVVEGSVEVADFEECCGIPRWLGWQGARLLGR
jgi:hypothetical protein